MKISYHTPGAPGAPPSLAASFTQRGIALIIVMISIFILAILAGGFAYSMKVETKLARNSNNETELEWLGRSGVEYARWILGEQMKIPNEPYDAENQVWAGGQGGFGTTNSALAEVQREVHLGNGSFTWKITDLEQKWNINTANEQILQQALIVMEGDAGDFTSMVGAILDWIDPDDREHDVAHNTETDYYKWLNPP
jgi:general secretion pathway protein K